MAPKKDITCPLCGKLLGSTSSTNQAGTKYCNICKRYIRWDATPNGVYTAAK